MVDSCNEGVQREAAEEASEGAAGGEAMGERREDRSRGEAGDPAAASAPAGDVGLYARRRSEGLAATMSKLQPRRAGVATGRRAHEIRDAALVILDRSNMHTLFPCRDGK